MTAPDPLVELLKAERKDGPDTPEFQVGSSVGDDPAMRYLGVDRIAHSDHQGGLETGRTLTGRRYLIAFPHSLTPWVVGALGAYLSDDEWDEAARIRDDEKEAHDG